MQDVDSLELAGNDAARKTLYELGSRGMTVAQLIAWLEVLGWEQELRLLKPPGEFRSAGLARILCIKCHFCDATVFFFLPEPVHITLQPESQYVREGDSVIIRCAATGFPSPR